jgi:WD40 repeat protein
LAFAPDGKSLAVLDDGVAVRLWALGGAEPGERPPVGHRHAVTWLSFAAGDTRLAAASDDNVLRIWDVSGGQMRRGPDVPLRPLNCRPGIPAVAIGPDGKTVAVPANWEQGGVDLWDVTGPRARKRQSLGASAGTVESVAFAPDGQTLAAGCYDGKIRLWDVGSEPPALRATVEGYEGVFVFFSGDGRVLGAGGGFRHRRHNPVTRLWDLGDGAPVLRLSLKQASGMPALFTDGKTLATRLGAVCLWDVRAEPAAELVTMSGEDRWIGGMAVSPDGRLVATAGVEGALALWDRRGRRRLAWQMSGGMSSVTFAPDSRHLAVGNDNGTVYVLRLAR